MTDFSGSASTTRTRTFTWDDPAITAHAGRTMNGLEFFHAMIRGDVPSPPISRMLGMRLAQAEHGRVVFELTTHESHCNPYATIHGGVICTILDSAMTCCVQTTLPAGVGCTTLDIQVQFLRPVFPTTGLLFAESELVNVGKRIGAARGKMIDTNGKIYATGSTMVMVLSPGD